MAQVTLEHLDKEYGQVMAVRDFTFTVEDQEFLVLLGPSGCGKTTTLRMVAGLEEPTRGTISIGGREVTQLEPKDRDIAMVFQNYALYPHMTVFENMAFGLRMRRYRPDEIRRRVESAAEILGLAPLLQRRPRQLSGGQRQRVALGRAIVREPQVFLMDEPLSNLDAQLRAQTRAELKSLHQRLGATVMYVTHDQVEALTLGTHIVVMKDGIVQQADTPDGLYRRPTNQFVATFVGTPPMNVLAGALETRAATLVMRLGTDTVVVPSPDRAAVQGFQSPRAILGVRPEHVHVMPHGDDIPLTGRIRLVEPTGHETLVYLDVADQSLIARADGAFRGESGQVLTVGLDPVELHWFHPETGARASA
ncbi:MAG: ABC transporter ATP-binding protein [Thermaerobacter sp.]|nr:ABC transporter ATP-binding protein [Thermaerobacter sp.]